MKTKIIALLITISGLTVQTSFGQEQTKDDKKEIHGIGMAAGFTTGYGVSYRYWPTKFGIQVTGTPIITKYETKISAGVTGLMTIKESFATKLYLYQGAHYMHNKTSYPDYLNETKENSTHRLNIGVGLGLEVMLSNISFNLMTGYAGHDIGGTETSLLPTIEVGVFYKL